MRNYFEYLPCGPAETAWGFHVSAAGATRVAPGMPYPPRRHPADHALDWSRGRTLNAFQLVALTAGRGLFETRAAPAREVRGGDCLLLFPGTWHRYRPEAATGWTEHWFELGGELTDRWLAESALSPSSPVLRPRSLRLLRELFHRLHECCIGQRPGHRAVAACLALTILSELRAQTAEAGADQPAPLVRRINRLLDAADGRPPRILELARKLGLSYPTLHRRFVAETGLSPKQYFRQTRLRRAAELLDGSSLAVKEIAAALGYHSSFHFSQQFKRYHGLAPLHWRRRGGRGSP